MTVPQETERSEVVRAVLLELAQTDIAQAATAAFALPSGRTREQVSRDRPREVGGGRSRRGHAMAFPVRSPLMTSIPVTQARSQALPTAR